MDTPVANSSFPSLDERLGKLRAVLLRLLKKGYFWNKGKIRIGRLLLSKVNGPMTIQANDGLYFAVPSILEPIAYHLAIRGQYEPPEERISMIKVGESQRILRRMGFSQWRMRDYLSGAPPQKEIVETGSEMFVARRCGS